jgi:hypothetical protein
MQSPTCPTSPPVPLLGRGGGGKKEECGFTRWGCCRLQIIVTHSLRIESMAHNLPHPRSDLESLLALLSVAMSWQHWATKAASVPSWGPMRPLRVATDCSGLGIPELALTEIADLNKSSVEIAWSCDVVPQAKSGAPHTTMHVSSRVEDGLVCVSKGFDHAWRFLSAGFRSLLLLGFFVVQFVSVESTHEPKPPSPRANMWRGTRRWSSQHFG